MKKSGTIGATIIGIAVVLVLIHTAVQEFAVILRWSWEQRVILLYVGLALDIVFTVDFLVRSYFALLHRRMGTYFFRERGWIDFLASIPILLLSSGPAILAAVAGSATVAGLSRVANVIEITKAVRIGRVLRLLRAVKLFPVAGGHPTEDGEPGFRDTERPPVSRLVCLSVCAVVLAGFVSGLLPVWFSTNGLEARTEQRFGTIARFVDEGNLVQPGGQATLAMLVALEPDLIAVHSGDRRVYSRYPAEYQETNLGPQDYLYMETGQAGIFFDIRPIHAAAARANLTYLAMVLVIVVFAGGSARRRETD